MQGPFLKSRILDICNALCLTNQILATCKAQFLKSDPGHLQSPISEKSDPGYLQGPAVEKSDPGNLQGPVFARSDPGYLQGPGLCPEGFLPKLIVGACTQQVRANSLDVTSTRAICLENVLIALEPPSTERL